MDKTMNMPFEASMFNLPKMRNDAEKVAKDMGFEKTKKLMHSAMPIQVPKCKNHSEKHSLRLQDMEMK
jgi:hypothetical protein